MAMLVCTTTASILSGRISHVPVPWSEMIRPSPFGMVLLLAIIFLLLFRWIPQQRQRNAQRKRQLEALLKELDGQ